MTLQAISKSHVTSRLLPVATALLATGIFVADTVTSREIAIGVLYAGVVLMAASFCGTRGLVLVVAGCVALIVVAFALSESSEHLVTDVVNTIISIASVGLAAYFALQRKSAEASLREKASLLDLTHDMIFVRGMNDVITYWNRGAEERYGWTSEEAVNTVTTTHKLLKTIFPAPLEEINAELFRKGEWNGELVHATRNGKPVVVDSRWALQRDKQGQPSTVLETNTDITERKQAENALRAAQAELAHISRVTTLGEMAASIAHEINQPLAAVVAQASAGLRWLNRESPDLGEAREAFAHVLTSAGGAAEVVKRVRALARKSPMQINLININEVIKDVVALMRSEIDHKGIVLRVEFSDDLPMIRGDRVHLQQVILNLIVNAIEAVDDSKHRNLAISSRKDAQNVLVSVCDSGVGLDPERIDHIFDSFYTTKSGGMGMGLSICRSIIEIHGGRISAHANSPCGAIFEFELPSDRTNGVEQTHPAFTTAASR